VAASQITAAHLRDAAPLPPQVQTTLSSFFSPTGQKKAVVAAPPGAGTAPSEVFVISDDDNDGDDSR
jgi:hypothetical protein